MKGHCTMFKNGYGFLKGEDGKSYFLHQSDINMPGFRVLDVGQGCDFEVEEDPKGPKAVNCQPLQEQTLVKLKGESE